jgi:dCTP diphosphatase
MSSISVLMQKVIHFRDERDWEQFHNPKDVALSLVLEAAEVMEHFQWKSADEIKNHVKNHKEEIGEELADVFYWILLMAHDLKIDLGSAVEKKLAKNAEKYPIDKAKGSHKKYTKIK